MTKITLPDKISVKDLKENKYQVVVEPLYPGFGVNLGNTLRRVLLSSLPGAAVTSFKIEGAQHEFDSITHVKEDLIEVMLNLKQLRLKVFSDEPVKLSLDTKGEKVVTAADITKNADVEIINTDLVIATLTDKSAKFNMELVVAQGLGYVTVEQQDNQEKLDIGNVAIDANYSPILNVGYKVTNVRVGKMTNYEQLVMDILTDGTTDAQTAMTQAASILRDHFSLLINEEPVVEEEEKPAKKATKKTAKKATKKEE
jgi:DNA-directed RNA polymerase subunit alpha